MVEGVKRAKDELPVQQQMRRSSYQRIQLKEGLSHLLSPKSGHNVMPQLKMIPPPPCRSLLHIPHLHRRLLPPGRFEFTREHYFYSYGGYHLGDGRNRIKSTVPMPSELLKHTIIRQSGGGDGGGGVVGGGTVAVAVAVAVAVIGARLFLL